MVGLVLRYSQQARSVRNLLDQNAIGNIISIEASEHIVPSHGAFFMRNWRRKQKYSGGFMLEKCCHDIDFYSMITASRPIKVASFVQEDHLFLIIYQLAHKNNILEIG